MLRSILVVLSCRHALPHDSILLRPMRAMHKNEGINTHDHTFIPLMQISITSRNCAEASIRSKHQIFQRIILLALGLGGRFATLGLFVINIVAVISHTDITPAGMQQHHLWGTRLMMLVLWEPGKLSLDCMWLKRFWSA